jgi:hypothetical protein
MKRFDTPAESICSRAQLSSCCSFSWLLTGLLAGGLLAASACWNGSSQTPFEEKVYGPPLYVDVTAGSGVEFTYRNGQEAGHLAILESLGGGVALIDYDGDGLLDIFVTGGGFFDGKDRKEIKGHPCRLYRNLGNFKFKDVTQEVGLDKLRFYTHGAAVGDYDCDGWPDLLVTGWGRVALFHNEPVDPTDPTQGRKFREVTREARLADNQWSTSAAWADLDGDGYPDLYICHYVNWSFQNHPPCKGYTSAYPRDVCPPKTFQGLAHILYRNNRDGTFTDMSARAGIRVDAKKEDLGKGLGVVIADLNNDRRPDIYVANDTVDNFLYMNRGRWKFEEVGLSTGVARDDNANPQGSMGVDVGDYNRSGLASLFVTNYENEMHALYRNQGDNMPFLFATPTAGIAEIGQRFVGFGTSFVDVDNDGWEDLVIANGHVIRHPVVAGLKQRPVLLRNLGTGRFQDITPEAGPYFRSDHISRGLALGDLDNDGRPDLVISNLNEPVVILRNVAGGEGKRPHWLGIEVARPKNHNAVGARITVEVKGTRRTRFVKGGGSYLSSSDPRHLFGLGALDRVDTITVDWPSGRTQVWDGKHLAVDRYWRLVEGEKKPQVWKGQAKK